ncbi:MAG: acetoin utilization protein AcuC [Thermoplasmata archaeon]|nr:acetoin utilization protein AcuC [Thermoplasmata archaeon]
MPDPRVTIVADPRFRDYDFGPGHPWDAQSRWLAVRLLEAWEHDGRLPGPLRWIRNVPPAEDEVLRRFHSSGHLARVRSADRQGAGELLDRGDTPSFPGCYAAAARVVEGTCEALEAVLAGTTRRAFQPAGGLHHGASDAASGFCIFNDLAVAIATARARPLRRVAYLDIDVHHGDGVMYGFYSDGGLLDIDFHETGKVLFPGTGEIEETGRGDGAGLKVNVPLPPGAGDEAFLPLFRRIVPELIRSYRPELIVLQCGVDAHDGDRLGHLRYSHAAYREAIATLMMLAEEVAGGRLLVTGGGGYTASNVSVVLANAGAALAGPTGAGSIDGALPPGWRTEFEAATGSTPPTNAVGPTPRSGSRWTDGDEDRMILALERALGRSLPAVR